MERRILGMAGSAVIAPLALLLTLAPRPAAAAASPWTANPQSQVRLISRDAVAARRGELRLGVQFRIAPRWHVYWKNSGDAGFAPAVTWQAAPGLAAPELLWPAPHRYELPGGLEAFGYAGEVVYPVRAAIAAAPGSARLRFAATVDYLVCEIDCVPYRYDLSFDQPLGDTAQADPATAPLLDAWWRQVPLALTAGGPPERQDAGTAREAPSAASTTATRPNAGRPPATARLSGAPGIREITARSEILRSGPSATRFELRLRGVAGAPGGADLFFESHPSLELGRPRVVAAAGELRFTAPVRRKDTSVPLPGETEVAWTATGLEQAGRPGPLALAGRQMVPITDLPPAELPAAAAAAPALPTAAPHGLRGSLAAADPRLLALGAVAAALLTLEAWGLLRARRAADARQAPPVTARATASTTAGEPPAAGRATVAAGPELPAADRREWQAALRREAAGFLALLLTLALLYALSLEISPEGMAGVELALLAMTLLAWLRRRIERPALARGLLAAALAVCALVPPWVAGRNRLSGDLGAAGSVPAAAAAASGPARGPARSPA